MGKWHRRYKVMKRGMKWTNDDVAEIIGNSKDSVKCITQPSKKFPRWARLAIVVYERFNEGNSA